MPQIIQPSIQDRDQARARLNALRRSQDPLTILDPLEPSSALGQAIETILKHFARGNAIWVHEVGSEMTTQEAAHYLGVSRPHLVGLLERGEIPFHKVGNQRRVRLDEVKAFSRRRREAALDELSRLSQELGL